MTKTKIKSPLLDQTEGQQEESQERKLSYPKIQGQRKRSLQALLKMPLILNISLLANLPMQRSQVIQLMTQECNRIKSLTRVTMMNNPLTRRPYPFDLNKPLSLIRDHRGRQVIPQDFFVNNDLEYLKGGDLSRQYSTSVTKTKAAIYEIKWIEDLV
uniref:Uncharacterized protein n=1 Tax=Tanacetum cinerariifolium TaxID=118510 RepID=A0A6L2MFR6_TANCI|nr:hypothetical protein [Tanacetum cinerariifolium]